MIDAKAVVRRHNPVLTEMSTDSPLSVGNGGFCFTADITGLQTLYSHYSAANFPLCTMSSWGWHTAPTAGGKLYEWEDLQLTAYQHAGRQVFYPTERKPGNEHVYDWLRHNPHKFNLARVGLCLHGQDISPEMITEARQELDLYSGLLTSWFLLEGEPVEVETVCGQGSDTLGVKLCSRLHGLGLRVDFSYGSHEISGADWGSPRRHFTAWEGDVARRVMDDVEYFVGVGGGAFGSREISQHSRIFSIPPGESQFTIHFSKTLQPAPPYASIYASSCAAWQSFWHKTGLADFSQTIDPRAAEIERRMVLSLYLLKIQGMDSLPHAETGLTVNSWYGRFHTEMYLWNSGFLPLWNLGEYLLPSLEWFRSQMSAARRLAAFNGYRGLRWPKQPAHTGRDAPSMIAPLLVWQQPHLIIMLEMLYETNPSPAFLQKYWPLVEGLATFMESFLHQNPSGQYEILPPVMPAQETYDPSTVQNPMFEMEYFRHGLQTAANWASRLGHTTTWQQTAAQITPPKTKNGLYLAHHNAPDTYETYNKDHPMMLGTYGLFKSPAVDSVKMAATLKKVISCWQPETMWGWDYAMMAMCAITLGNPEQAVELLLSDNPKNQYVTSGNNYQRSRDDLPLYLPGNGSFLLALPMLLANLPKGWIVKTERIHLP
ncbi:MAG: glycoside hydrolase family 65 [Defluviitaleaceae bacterium]|nr:glycoside hydrolase family 65 [Defluviitaleaceae bacterium]